MFEQPGIGALDRATIDALRDGTHADPFAVLGPHQTRRGRIVRAFLPGALRVEVCSADVGTPLGVLDESLAPGLFSGAVPGTDPYILIVHWPGGVQRTEDPYAFGLLLSEANLQGIREGSPPEMLVSLGAHCCNVEGVDGVRFAVWAPNARRVAVVGDFNGWDVRRNPMRLRHDAGVWELFIPRLGEGATYKFAITGEDGEALAWKADPFARQAEAPPATASIVAGPLDHGWSDGEWMAMRARRQSAEAPLSIYEVHLGSWMHRNGLMLTWDEAARDLVAYVKMLGFTHIELLPIAEHPFGGSWGYQPLSLFAPTGRHGDREGFARFVDVCHRSDIGVIVDWVPAHFPGDAHGLIRFDGTPLFEYADPREGFHRDWNTFIYNFGRHEVRGFLIASALFWLEEFHIDGLRVDAVSSMLYRDYSRLPGEWIANVHGGRENLEAMEFIRQVNMAVARQFPGVITIAEESTAWPHVTAPVRDGGLGFDYKWNMGWMHDTLGYMGRDPVHRSWHHRDITFGLTYAFSERFVLAISHDEVVYGKRALAGKMPGDDWHRLANLRALLALMWTYPGKKLMFMGCEFAQPAEWNHDGQLAWQYINEPGHSGILRLVHDLNEAYRREPSLHEWDCQEDGFRWLVVDDSDNSVFIYQRRGCDGSKPLTIAVNMTPVARSGYRFGVPEGGQMEVVLNTDAAIYGGSAMALPSFFRSEPVPSHGHAQSLAIDLPPLAVVVLRPVVYCQLPDGS